MNSDFLHSLLFRNSKLGQLYVVNHLVIHFSSDSDSAKPAGKDYTNGDDDAPSGSDYALGKISFSSANNGFLSTHLPVPGNTCLTV
jgi:hypothetical protein